MKPVFTQELVPDAQGLWSCSLPLQSARGSVETSQKVRTSATVLSLAISLGVSGALFSSAEAADSMEIAALPSVADVPGALPSYGSDRPSGAAATYHTVAEGETVWDIAKRYRVAIEDIKTANGIAEDQVIQAGQVLKVPSSALSEPAIEQSLHSDSPDLVAASSLSTNSLSTAEEPEHLSGAESRVAPSSLSAFLEAQRMASELSSAQQESSLSAADEDPVSEDSRLSDSVAALPTEDLSQDFPEQFSAVEESELTSTASMEDISISEGQVVHRIGVGETIWSIARSHGIEPEMLRKANGVADPRLIFPGDSLVIPTDALIGRDERTAKLPQLNELVESQIEARPGQEPVEVLSAYDAEPEVKAVNEAEISLAGVFPAAEADSAVDDISEEAVDPYVVGLLSDVTEANQGQQQAVVVASADEELPEFVGLLPGAERETASEASSQEAAYGLPEVEVVNPQFSPAAETDAVDDVDESSLSSENLLAAAPLGSEVYSPIIENPEGRVVSPSMPVLPDQGEYLPEAPAHFRGYAWPAQGVLTSGYGWRWGRMHRGIDIAGPVGTPIFSAGPGVVVRSGWNSGGYGNMVDVRHPDGSMTRYAHNSRLLVQEGQQVRQGQQIAEMGSTGYSTGPHLHFEIHLPDEGTVNPMAYLPAQ
ncbi:MAG: LysM peptidoglycan-binding domain-containing M23 family metallopeptidase [Leptolyngbya sp. SIO1E4]|nr:LysM peptidoglycan-binding domain-containing M23 family metallopeptidase [Leptolyngbya sp. SIO1E4]